MVNRSTGEPAWLNVEQPAPDTGKGLTHPHGVRNHLHHWANRFRENLREIRTHIGPLLQDERPELPWFVVDHTAESADAPHHTDEVRGEIYTVLGFTGVPSGIFDLESLVTWDPHMLLNVLGNVLTRDLGEEGFTVLLRKYTWPGENPNPYCGEKGSNHPLSLVLYHWAYAHHEGFRQAVQEKARAYLNQSLSESDVVILYVHSYGAIIAKDVLNKMDIPNGKEVIIVALGHAFSNIAYGLSPVGPKTSAEEIEAMAEKAAWTFLARVEKDALSGNPPIKNANPHLQVKEFHGRGWERYGVVTGHHSIRTRPDVGEELETFLTQALSHRLHHVEHRAEAAK